MTLLTDSIHANLFVIKNVGVLLLGENSCGKSDASLDLLRKGHQLVADDVVNLFKQDNMLFGKPNALGKGFLYCPGLGVLNIAKIYSEQAICSQSKIDLAIALTQTTVEFDDIQLIHHHTPLLDQTIPTITLPGCQHRHLSTLIEVATDAFILQENGYNAAVDFNQQQRQEMDQ